MAARRFRRFGAERDGCPAAACLLRRAAATGEFRAFVGWRSRDLDRDGYVMLPFHPKRLVIAQHKFDYRRHWNGMLGESYKMGFDPYAGDCVVFVKTDRTQLRALAGDARGLFLVARRFDGGRLGLPWLFQSQPTTKTISLAELALMLEGASFTVHRHVKAWR